MIFSEPFDRGGYFNSIFNIMKFEDIRSDKFEKFKSNFFSNLQLIVGGWFSTENYMGSQR